MGQSSKACKTIKQMNSNNFEKKQKLLNSAPYIISGASISLFSVLLIIIFIIISDKCWILFALGFIIGQILIAIGYIKFYKK